MRPDYVPARVRREVVRRAWSRCEYCGLAQEGQEATFHVDHVVPASAGGRTVSANLALACVTCSLRKSDRQQGVDPLTQETVRLFDPRADAYAAHFEFRGVTLVGVTPIGRATLETLRMNNLRSRGVRLTQQEFGTYPPPPAWTRRKSES